MVVMIPIINAFPANYEIIQDEDLPGTGGVETFEYREAGSPIGLSLLFCPQGRPKWIGTFGEGYRSTTVITGIYTCPDPNYVCVISRGQGFLIDVMQPNKVIKLPIFPICISEVASAEKVVVFGDMTRLIGIGASGIAWRTREISWDGIRVTHVVHGKVSGLVWDAARQREVSFTLCLSTGEVIGGIHK